ncbi:PTS system, sorbose-specific IIB component [Enterococcus sp. DIV2402]|jgi:PTS system sorbose-specific IIB component|uniref:PTS system, sorbose-specific IIB component n=1 Tax=Candidatus Enterococcus lowellii TaxID=2230877 RepID=A0ABZ2SJ20_9ENTE|nr:mannose/fructose/sorbose PTS transporter subunit IIB [Enterococcus sp. DIV2402]MBO0463080.1 PTS sugar transporter subunit IIB [Enterococcus sp. DIV2402]
MHIRLARIDDRLIHGQVATVWAKEAGAQRIIVVSKEVSEDQIRKTLVKQAAPPGIKANIIDVDKAVRVYNNPKYANETVFYLFTNPTEVVEIIQKGVPIQSINIGGMQYKTGKKQVTKAVSVDEKDVIAFRKLAELGVELDLRVVATDTKGDFEAKLKEASF